MNEELRDVDFGGACESVEQTDARVEAFALDPADRAAIHIGARDKTIPPARSHEPPSYARKKLRREARQAKHAELIAASNRPASDTRDAGE